MMHECVFHLTLFTTICVRHCTVRPVMTASYTHEIFTEKDFFHASLTVWYKRETVRKKVHTMLHCPCLPQYPPQRGLWVYLRLRNIRLEFFL